MGYDNRFELRIKGEVTRPAMFCRTCNVEKPGKFCDDCGTQLDLVEVPMSKKEIIAELRDFSDDCAYLLGEKEGSSEETGSGHQIEDDILKFSKRYPDLIFQLDCTWDSGFGDDPSRYYFKNGKKQDAKAKVVYNEPEF